MVKTSNFQKPFLPFDSSVSEECSWPGYKNFAKKLYGPLQVDQLNIIFWSIMIHNDPFGDFIKVSQIDPLPIKSILGFSKNMWYSKITCKNIALIHFQNIILIHFKRVHCYPLYQKFTTHSQRIRVTFWMWIKNLNRILDQNIDPFPNWKLTIP